MTEQEQKEFIEVMGLSYEKPTEDFDKLFKLLDKKDEDFESHEDGFVPFFKFDESHEHKSHEIGGKSKRRRRRRTKRRRGRKSNKNK